MLRTLANAFDLGRTRAAGDRYSNSTGAPGQPSAAKAKTLFAAYSALAEPHQPAAELECNSPEGTRSRGRRISKSRTFWEIKQEGAQKIIASNDGAATLLRGDLNDNVTAAARALGDCCCAEVPIIVANQALGFDKEDNHGSPTASEITATEESITTELDGDDDVRTEQARAPRLAMLDAVAAPQRGVRVIRGRFAWPTLVQPR